MSTVQEALAMARRYGVTIEVRGDRLHLKAPVPPPPEVIEKLREAKPAILQLLARPRPEPERAGWDATDWQVYFAERASIREHDGHRPRAEAERLAWGELLAAWHRTHGSPPPGALCVGCGAPLSGAEVFEVWDGARAHIDDGYRCLIAYGKRWRAAAAAGLAALGIEPPRSA